MTQLIGPRVRALREERGLSQEALSRLLGFNDRQTLSAIENGERQVSAEELLLLVQRLDASLDYFTDPFQLIGEGRFSWRQTNVGPKILSAYERSAGRWIAAYRTVGRQVGKEARLLRGSLGFARHHSYEDAAAAGERFASELKLGDVPARSLANAVERELGILVLNVNATDGISGAACRLPELDVILINRNEVPGRRHFDLAHELFHILTWDTMTPGHIEEAVETSKSRVERLANSFASAVLMPWHSLDRYRDWKGLDGGDLVKRLNAAADDLLVTASSLKWRLVALGRLAPASARAVPDAALRHNGHDGREHSPPPQFSKPFVEVMAEGLKQGHISVRRLASLLDLPLHSISELFGQYSVDAPDEW